MSIPNNHTCDQNEHVDIHSLFSILEQKILFFRNIPNPTTEQIKQYPSIIKELLVKHNCSYMISDTRAIGLPSVEFRESIRSSLPWSKKLKHLILVSTNPLLPVSTAFISNAKKSTVKIHFVKTIEEAITLFHSLKKNTSEE